MKLVEFPKFRKSLLNGTAQKKYTQILKEYKNPKILYVGPNIGVFEDPTILFLLQYVNENGGEVFVLEAQRGLGDHAGMGAGSLDNYMKELKDFNKSGVPFRTIQPINNELGRFARTKIKVKFDVVVSHQLMHFLMLQQGYLTGGGGVLFGLFTRHLRKGGVCIFQEKGSYKLAFLPIMEGFAEARGYTKKKYTTLVDKAYIKTEWELDNWEIVTRRGRWDARLFSELVGSFTGYSTSTGEMPLLQKNKFVLRMTPRYECNNMLVVKKP